MAYGSSSRVFIENEPAGATAKEAPSRSGAHSWQRLSEACRLALVEQTLGARGDLADGFPVAL